MIKLNYINEAVHETKKKTLSYEDAIKKYKAKIEEGVNEASEKAFESFKRVKHYGDEVEFYKKNKSAPKVKGIEPSDSDYYCIYLKVNCNSDMYLFYQDEVTKHLNKNEELKKLGFKFNTEDYPGIFIMYKN